MIRIEASNRARIFWPDGRVVEFDSDRVAFEFWLALPGEERVAYRRAGDDEPLRNNSYWSSP